jgi:hypothetical protein
VGHRAEALIQNHGALRTAMRCITEVERPMDIEEITGLLQELVEQLHLEAPLMQSPEGQASVAQLAQRTSDVAERIRSNRHSHSNGREFAVICWLIDDGVMLSPRREFNDTYGEVVRAFRAWEAEYFAAQRGEGKPVA